MKPLSMNQFMDLSVVYYSNGSKMKKEVVAGKTDTQGKQWILVDTTAEQGYKTRQWIQLNFFQSWLKQMD